MCQLEAALSGMKTTALVRKGQPLCRTCSSLEQSMRVPCCHSISAGCKARKQSGIGLRNRRGITARLGRLQAEPCECNREGNASRHAVDHRHLESLGKAVCKIGHAGA